ncbi:MAG: DUF72 domain-containing protein [Desulfosalsimonas sp.]|uniref:DUF72 domain-containing protein n=1 Tax=Desulfosalsimonas sp. TaxID=3073848 RepID=UPI0039708292
MRKTTDQKTENEALIEKFRFRHLHPNVLIGTASDRYAGWGGQIYTPKRYEGRISRRSNKVGGKTFQEEVLPVESVEEYFEHFPVLELDYTFYSPLLEENGKPAKNFHVLKTYAQHITENDKVVMKVPRIISAQKIRRSGKYIKNETYLDPEIFTKRFYEPANAILGASLAGLIFEQEYQRKQDRRPAEKMAEDLDRFFESVPQDTRYHIEFRTEAYLSSPVFAVLEKYGVGQVLSHWTWLPSLKKQLAKADGRIFNSGKKRIVRLMTPRGTRYEDAYARAHPFDKLVDEMLQTAMIKDTVELIEKAVQEDTQTSILINNRAGGNAPLIARRIVEEYLAK